MRYFATQERPSDSQTTLSLRNEMKQNDTSFRFRSGLLRYAPKELPSISLLPKLWGEGGRRADEGLMVRSSLSICPIFELLRSRRRILKHSYENCQTRQYDNVAYKERLYHNSLPF